MQAASLIIRQYSGVISLRKDPFKELNLLKLCMHLNCSQQILTAVLNGKDNKNAQHRKDLSECLHTPDAQTCTDMWFTNVEVLRVEYKIYFSSTQNVLLVLFCFKRSFPFIFYNFTRL